MYSVTVCITLVHIDVSYSWGRSQHFIKKGKKKKNHLEIFWFLFDQQSFFNEYVITVLNLIQIIKIPTSSNFTSIKPMLWEFPPNYFISGDFQELAQLLTQFIEQSGWIMNHRMTQVPYINIIFSQRGPKSRRWQQKTERSRINISFKVHVFVQNKPHLFSIPQFISWNLKQFHKITKHSHESYWRSHEPTYIQ